MAILPFRWQGPVRLETIRSRLASRALGAVRGWALSPDALECELRAERADADFGEWHELKGDTGRAIVVMPADAFGRLGSGLVGLPAPDGSGLAAGIGRRAMNDLLQSMTGLTAATLSAIERPPAATLRERHGVARFSWEIAGVRLAIYLDATLCDALAPARPATGAQLQQREEAVMPERVVLRAVLELGHAALEDTLDLKPGDVIKTNARLDARVRLHADGGDSRLEGALVASGERRAVRFLNVSQT